MINLTRKEFLKASGGLGMLSLMPFNEWNKAIPGPHTSFASQPNVTIRSIDPFLMPGHAALFVRVTSSEGVIGWGEANRNYAPIVLGMINELKGRVEGKSVWDTEYLWNLMFFKEVDAGQNGLLAGAIAGIDHALWDLKGKLLGQPVWSLLGGPYREEIKVYGSCHVDLGLPNPGLQAAHRAEELVEKGYDAVKIKMQARELTPSLTPGVSPGLTREVRQAVGDQVTVFFDANNNYPVNKAIRVGKTLYEKYNIASFEEPVDAHNLKGLAQVADALDIPVAAGGHAFNRWQFKELILRGRADRIHPGPCQAGGITEATKIATVASAFDVPVMCRHEGTELAAAAMFHFSAAIHNASDFQEYDLAGRSESVLQRYFKDQLAYQAGQVTLPNGPGLGLELNESQIERDKIN